MGVCDPNNSMHSLYGNYLPNNIFTSIEDIEKTIEKHHHEVAGIVLEPVVQGAGGMRIHKPDYLKKVRELCTKYDIIFIADEIATGFGHTGKMWACEHADVVPDIITIGKCLTGGMMTLAAMCTTKHISDTISNSEIGVLMHGPTFMGNPLACSVANASIDLLLESNWQEKVSNINKIFTQKLNSLEEVEIVKDIRTIGAIGVVELHSPDFAQFIQDECQNQGVWIRPFGKLIYSIVAYTITNEELNKICDAMINAIKKTDIQFKNMEQK